MLKISNMWFRKSLIALVCGVIVNLPHLAFAQSSAMELAGIVKSHETAVLSSRMDGLINAVNVRVGDTFNKGDVLLSIDCTLYQAALSKAKAEVEYARNEYKSIRSLEELNSATKVQVARSAAEFAKAQSDLDAADYRVKQCQVVAPFDGTVVQSWAKTYESVNAKSKLIEIINNRNLVAEFLAPSTAINKLTAGRAFTFLVGETGKNYTATIDMVVPYVDSVSQTVKVISRFDSSDTGLWAGMSGLVILD